MGERFPLRSTNTEDGVRLDIKVQNFWDQSKQSTFLDVRIFNSHAAANCTSSTDACYRRHECEKRRGYKQRVLKVEHGTLTPLVLSTSGGRVCLPRLLSRVSQVSFLRNTTNHTATLSGYKITLIDSAITCLRGPRSTFHAPARDFNLMDHPLDLICAEVQLQA